MKAKRDLIQEIVSIQTRSVGVPRDIALSHRFRLLDSALEAALLVQDSNARSELMRYLPIGTVTCIESYFRFVFRDLINYGAPYSDNAAEFNKVADVKLDWRILQAIHGKAVSIGDFLSHILPLNNLQDIKTNLNILLNDDFLEKIKDVQLDQYTDGHYSLTEIRPLMGDILNAVNTIFEERHIYCHELALRTKANPVAIKKNYELTKLFLLATEEFMRDLLSEWKDLTCQVDMNNRAYAEFKNIDGELNQLVEKYSKGEESEGEGLKEVQKKWEQYRETSANHLASGWNGGTGWPLIYYSHMTAITHRRVEGIRKERQYEESLAELDSLDKSDFNK